MCVVTRFFGSHFAKLAEKSGRSWWRLLGLSRIHGRAGATAVAEWRAVAESVDDGRAVAEWRVVD